MCKDCTDAFRKDVLAYEEVTEEELFTTDHDLYRWNCCVKGCPRHTKVWCFIIGPFYWHPGWKQWFDVYSHIFLCYEHGRHYSKADKDGQLDQWRTENQSDFEDKERVELIKEKVQPKIKLNG